MPSEYKLKYFRRNPLALSYKDSKVLELFKVQKPLTSTEDEWNLKFHIKQTEQCNTCNFRAYLWGSSSDSGNIAILYSKCPSRLLFLFYFFIIFRSCHIYYSQYIILWPLQYPAPSRRCSMVTCSIVSG